MARHMRMVVIATAMLAAHVNAETHEDARISACALGLKPNYFLLQSQTDFRKATKRLVDKSGKAGVAFLDVAGGSAEYLDREKVDESMSLTEAVSIYVSYLEPDVRKDYFKCVNTTDSNRVEVTLESETDTETALSVTYFGTPAKPAKIKVTATPGFKVSSKSFSLASGGSKPITVHRKTDDKRPLVLSFSANTQVRPRVLTLRPPARIVWIPLKYHPVTGLPMSQTLQFQRGYSNTLPLPEHAFFCDCFGFEATRNYEGGHSYCNPGTCAGDSTGKMATLGYVCNGNPSKEQVMTFYVHVLREFPFNADVAPPAEQCDSVKAPKRR